MDNIEIFMWYLTSAFALLIIALVRYLHNNEIESFKDEIARLKAEVEALSKKEGGKECIKSAH